MLRREDGRPHVPAGSCRERLADIESTLTVGRAWKSFSVNAAGFNRKMPNAIDMSRLMPALDAMARV